MKVSVSEFGIKRMKTKWGIFNRDAKKWLNLELAKSQLSALNILMFIEWHTYLKKRNRNENSLLT